MLTMHSGRRRKNEARTGNRTAQQVPVVNAKVFLGKEAAVDVDLIVPRLAAGQEEVEVVDSVAGKAVKAANAGASIAAKEMKVANAVAFVGVAMRAVQESSLQIVATKEAVKKNHTDLTDFLKVVLEQATIRNLTNRIVSRVKEEIADHHAAIAGVKAKAASVATIERVLIVPSRRTNLKSALSSNQKLKTSVDVLPTQFVKKTKRRKNNRPTATDSFASTSSSPTVASARAAKPMNLLRWE